MSRMQERVADYRRMGVPVVWIVDPRRRVAYTGEADGRLTPADAVLTVPGTPVSIAVEAIFGEPDRLSARSAQ